MGSMLEALAKAGAISKEKAEREEGLHEFKLAQTKQTFEGVTLENLRNAETIGKFEHIAKTLLLAGNITTSELVRAVNTLKGRLGPTKPLQCLVALTYHLRDNLLDYAPTEVRERMIRAAFRKAGSRFPDDEKGGKKKRR